MLHVCQCLSHKNVDRNLTSDSVHTPSLKRRRRRRTPSSSSSSSQAHLPQSKHGWCSRTLEWFQDPWMVPSPLSLVYLFKNKADSHKLQEAVAVSLLWETIKLKEKKTVLPSVTSLRWRTELLWHSIPISPANIVFLCFFSKPGCSWVRLSQIPVCRELQTRTVFEKQRGQPTDLSSFPLWKSECSLSSDRTGFFFPLFLSYFHQLSLILSASVVPLPLVLRSALAPVAPERSLWKEVTTYRLWRTGRTSQSD